MVMICAIRSADGRKWDSVNLNFACGKFRITVAPAATRLRRREIIATLTCHRPRKSAWRIRLFPWLERAPSPPWGRGRTPPRGRFLHTRESGRSSDHLICPGLLDAPLSRGMTRLRFTLLLHPASVAPKDHEPRRTKNVMAWLGSAQP
jgi:hypothetical protein